MRAEQGAVEQAGLIGQQSLVSVLYGDEIIDMASAAADSGYFRTLGLRPIAGRFFGLDEDQGARDGQPAILAESA